MKKSNSNPPKYLINTFGRFKEEINFGDYILFQEYYYDRENKKYLVSTPRLVIYLGIFVCDQTIGFNYVQWINDNHSVYFTSEHGTYPTIKQVSGIASHIHWDDYIDILGHWKQKPNWKEIILAYRNKNIEEAINYDEIEIGINDEN